MKSLRKKHRGNSKDIRRGKIFLDKTSNVRKQKQKQTNGIASNYKGLHNKENNSVHTQTIKLEKIFADYTPDKWLT
jgi:hypothetical protein